MERASLRLTRTDLTDAAGAGLIGADQAEGLWAFLRSRERQDTRPRFDLTHLLWYAGAVIVMAAMGLFSTEAWSRYGGFTLAAIAGGHAVAFIAAGAYLWHTRDLRTPGGLLITVAVVMVPVAIFGIQDALGWWGLSDASSYHSFFPWAKGSRLFMELGTVAASLVALRFFRFPFITMPLAAALWFLSIDLAPWLFGEEWTSWNKQKIVSVGFGLAMLAIAWRVDVASRGDFAFWLHLFGLAAAWGGLSAMESDSDLGRGLYCLVNVLMLFLSVLLMRRAYAVFGALGIAFYLVDLAHRVFKDSLLFPLALSLVGIVMIALGLLYFRKRQAVTAWVERMLPRRLQALRPAHAREE